MGVRRPAAARLAPCEVKASGSSDRLSGTDLGGDVGSLGGSKEARRGAQELLGGGRIERPGEEVALALLAPETPELIELLRRLDPFGHHAHVETPGERDDRPHDLEALVLEAQAGDEGAVDLQ